GYDTLLGKHFDGGVELSGGQWQRISLARAFARDADLIVLDEPSSALDPIAESHLYERFRDLTNDKSALFITHRLGSVRLADKIIVLNDGKIVGIGSHNELMAAEGDYAVLFRTQAENYADGIFE
ncbi:MAG: ATP-binding cassette domain-containing protein, partial [Gemmatimonadetes bacterium]|nr:ATP-binding cassette domain-containing protein [Gemmatimonadota bacterium]